MYNSSIDEAVQHSETIVDHDGHRAIRCEIIRYLMDKQTHIHHEFEQHTTMRNGGPVSAETTLGMFAAKSLPE
jgi:hypothetical protein